MKKKTVAATHDTKTAVKVADVKETVKSENKTTIAADTKSITANAAPVVKEEAPAKAATQAKPATKKSAASKKPSKAADAKPTQKKAGRKPKPLTIDDIAAKLSKLVNKAAANKIVGPVAVDIEVWGWDDGANRHMYIEIINGRITVAPYNYDDRNVEAYISFADAKDVVDGKLSLKEAFSSGKLNASGDVRSALIFASLF